MTCIYVIYCKYMLANMTGYFLTGMDALTYLLLPLGTTVPAEGVEMRSEI